MQLLILFGAKYLYLVALAVAAVYVFMQPRKEQKRLLILACIALPVCYLVAKVGSSIYYDPRPFVVGNFAPLVPHAADNGFPSDHTLLMAAIASVVYAHSRKVGALLWALAILVGTSRVAAGIHHPLDIAGSIVIAAATTAGVYFLLQKYQNKVWKNT